jgi:hypothetical protein
MTTPTSASAVECPGEDTYALSGAESTLDHMSHRRSIQR